MLDLFGSSQAGERKVLRPHQEQAIAMVRRSLGSGNRRVVLQGAVGFGKTLVSARIIEGALSKGNRVVFTAPMISLIDQTVAAFQAEGIEDIGVIQANHPRTNPSARVQVASVQTLQRRGIPEAALVIVDEAHIQFREINRLMDERRDVFFVGLSATPWSQGMGLRWQDLVIPCTISSLIKAGFLSQFTVYAPDVPDLSRVKVERGDYVEGQLAEVMGDAALVGNVVATWLEKGEGRPTLVFGVNRAHAKALMGQFLNAGVSAAYVDGFTDSVERGVINRQFRAGDIRVICSVRTMTTGVDLPVSCIVDAAPTKSEALHVQKIGRGLRVNPGTEDLVVFDHAGNSLRLGLVTDIHHETLDKTKPGQRQASNGNTAKSPDALPKPCSECGALFTGLVCPSCGHERKPAHGVKCAEGELVILSGRKAAATREDKARFYAMALWLDRERQKSGRLAKGLFRGKFGEWPDRVYADPIPPDASFMSYERSRRIAYAKSKARGAQA